MIQWKTIVIICCVLLSSAIVVSAEYQTFCGQFEHDIFRTDSVFSSRLPLLTGLLSPALEGIYPYCYITPGTPSETIEETRNTTIEALTTADTNETTTNGTTNNGTSTSGSNATFSETPENFTIAFIGDQGIRREGRAVLRLINRQDADMLLHLGDFDYKNSPWRFDAMLTRYLGRDFPFLAVKGNHDEDEWPDYQRRFYSRLKNIDGMRCSGDLGVNSVCTYKGMTFLLSGIGMSGDDINASTEYIEDASGKIRGPWKICAWHKNMKLMQVGNKQDEVSWGAYDACREAGAIIMTAHEHSYSRTHLMSDFESQTIADTGNNLTLDEGKSFAVVSGLGGKSIREQNETQASNPWWASIYTATQGAKEGAFFCEFNHESVHDKARCYFMNIDDEIIDEFELTSKVD